MDGSNTSSDFENTFGLLSSEEESITKLEEINFSADELVKPDAQKDNEPEHGIGVGSGGAGETSQQLSTDVKGAVKSGDLKDCFRAQTESLEETINQWHQTFEELERFEEQVAEQLANALQHAEDLNVSTSKQKEECRQRLQALSKALSLF